ncbi:MAG: ImmA/IrrE family metallo-endopeptidase [Acidobacteria bacterium]|nr:MAG: ImmA/IrrE family metallo-endopeptidase [Acidobacteriota bacterium]
MDAFEVARIRARAWHEEAAAGDDPGAWELVERVARARGYELVPLAAGDALLDSAEAMLDRQLEAIFYRAAESTAERAALIAHELGHLALHEHQPAICRDDDVDASTPDEPSPAGASRVEAYGVRERQELQANVFARELLLPRPLARALFLDRGLTASAIAGRRQLPLDVVRQQLCDALLIPAGDDGGDGETAGGGGDLDPSQEAAARHRGGALLLEAGPGTGKTRALVGRVVHLVESGADPASILALTFSNKAAAEITERVAEVLPAAAPLIWTGTFHAFGLELLRQHHQRLELEADVPVVDRSDAIELLEELLPTLGLIHHQNLYEPAIELREILAAISRAKDELVGEEAYAALARAMLDAAGDDAERVAAERALEVAAVYRVYQHALRAKRAVDFGDLIMLPVQLLESEPGVRRAVRLRHRHVLVDEYQDVNRASARLLQAVAGDGSRLWVVGDARQSIYRFRGASAANLARFGDDFPGATARALARNYRSTAAIVAACSRFARTMRVSRRCLDLDLEAARGDVGPPPDLRVAADPEGEAAAIAARVRQLEAAGVPLYRQAVLCRSNATLNALAEACEARGIPVLHLGSLFERDEVRDMLSLLTLFADAWGSGLVRVAALPAYAVPLADVRAVLAKARQGESTVLELLARPQEIEGVSPAGAAGLARLGRDLRGLDRAATPWQILATYLFEGSSYLAGILRSDAVADRMRAVALYQFLSFARSVRPVGSGFPATRLLDRVRRLVLLGEERDLRQIPAPARHLEALPLMTIHASKGLEFDAVHLPSLMSRGLPSTFQRPRDPPPAGMITRPVDGEEGDPLRADHDEEEECLFFVALSRARTHLHLYRPERVGKTRRKPSIFLPRLGDELLVVERPPALPRSAPPPPPPAVRVAPAGPIELSGWELEQYDRCPRRFLYGRVLELAGTRRDSAYYRTQRALYAVLDQLASLPAGRAIEGAWLRRRLAEAWPEHGPVDHAFEAEYRRLAEDVLDNLAATHAGLKAADSRPLRLDLDAGRVLLDPGLIAAGAGGDVVLRVLKTGRKGSYKADDLSLGLVQEAADARWGAGGYRLEVVHLLDRGLTPVAMSGRMRAGRLDKSRRHLRAIARGRFPAQPDPFRCPRCPYFFVCPALPAGDL